MCGIFGYVGQEPIDDIFLLTNIGAFNVKRGNQAFGYLAVKDDSYIIGRHDKTFSRDIDLSYLNNYKILLFHLLSSTGPKRIHPFETDQFIFAHNGILIDYTKFDNLYDNLGPVDSQYLLSAIQSHIRLYETPKAISESNYIFNGQRACWLWDKFDQSLYLWRVMSPIYIMQSSDSLVFSSQPYTKKYESLEEGIVYKIKDTQLQPVEKFDFYSPYHIKETA